MKKWAFLVIAIAGFLLKGCTQPMSEKEKNDFAMTIAKCWYIPKENAAGIPTVKIYVLMNPDASIKDVHVADAEMNRYNHDAVYKKAADNAIKTLKDCNPTVFLPKDKYPEWKEMELTFDPQAEPQP